MSAADPTQHIDRADGSSEAMPFADAPTPGETRTFVVTAMHRRTLGRFTLAAEDTMLTCGLWSAWLLRKGPMADWSLGETRTLAEPAKVTAEWGADGWRVTAVSP